MKPVVRALLLVTIGLSAIEAGAAKPMHLDALWQDPEVAAKRPPPGGGPWLFAIPPINDLRENSALVGVLGRRKLLSPDDRVVWLRSILSGLPARGVDLKMLSASDELTNDRDLAVLSLRSAWIDYYQGGFTTVVTFDVAVGKGRSAVMKTIRARATTTDEIAATMLSSCS